MWAILPNEFILVASNLTDDFPHRKLAIKVACAHGLRNHGSMARFTVGAGTHERNRVIALFEHFCQ